MPTVRTRFAPSPTGYLHIGGLRTALYSYLFAKQNQGTYVLRIEDTDQTRFVEGAVEKLLDVMKTMGMEADEGPMADGKPLANAHDLSYLGHKGEHGPYIQSLRTKLYQDHAQKLIDSGHAYYCFCTPAELDAMRAAQTAAKLAPMYDRRCLQLKPEDAAAKLASGMPKVIRLKMPRDRKIEFTDRVRGRVSFLGKEIDDQVLIKSDGLPTYHLANVVDDHYMEITHVLRAEEWIASTPKHLIMYEAFGWTPPEFAHLPLILNADKSKLSKRQNDVSVESYLAKGYSPEALINFIALCGWHPGKGSEQELFSMQDLIDQFSLEGVNKAGAIFNLEKLDWFNHLWSKIKFYRKLDREALNLNSSVQITIAKNQDRTYVFDDPIQADKFAQVRAEMLLELTKLEKHPYHLADSGKFSRALLVIEDKILQKPSDTINNLQYFFEPKPLDQKLLMNAKMGVDTEEKALESLKFCQAIIEKLPASHAANPALASDGADLAADKGPSLDQIKQTFLEAIKTAGRKNGEILWPLRAALTHEEFSVGAFETVWVLGQAETLKRLAQILNK